MASICPWYALCSWGLLSCTAGGGYRERDGLKPKKHSEKCDTEKDLNITQSGTAGWQQIRRSPP